jgi:hypothetical protein
MNTFLLHGEESMKCHELLSDSSKWTQGASARDARGYSLDPREPNAVCWCITGALCVCYKDFNERTNKVKTLNDVLKSRAPYWNDTPGRTYDEVVTLLRELDI